MKATRLLLAAALALSLASCTRTDPQPPTPTGTTTAAPTSPAATPSTTGTPRAWSSAPVVVTSTVSVPPVPRLVGIRTATHPEGGYDRITFDFARTYPGYDIRYVDRAIADGSGLPVTVPGRRFLQIIFRPAQAHDDSGSQVLTPRALTVNHPMMKAYAITGDFEAVLTVVLGLDDVVGFRVGVLPGEPSRIYVDVAA